MNRVDVYKKEEKNLGSNWESSLGSSECKSDAFSTESRVDLVASGSVIIIVMVLIVLLS